MKLSFEVGISEKHLFIFYFNQIWGNLYIAFKNIRFMQKNMKFTGTVLMDSILINYKQGYAGSIR
jgi:hypothetical protein